MYILSWNIYLNSDKFNVKIMKMLHIQRVDFICRKTTIIKVIEFSEVVI